MNAPGRSLGEKHIHFAPAPEAEPVLSVLMITYNHEPFIREALESVFMQQVDFPIEVVIGEDCSTDRTREVITECCKTAPFPVTLITSERNVGMHANFRRTLAACRGEFVALLEGDDYWTDAEKLKVQVSLLLSDPTLSLIGHRAALRFSDDCLPSVRASWPDPVVPVREIGDIDLATLTGFRFYFPTASAVLRRTIVKDLSAEYDALFFLDCVLWLEAALHGRVHVLPRVASVYRIGPTGVSHGANPHPGHSHHLLIAYDLSDRRRRKVLLPLLRERIHTDAHTSEISGSRGEAAGLLMALVRRELASFSLPSTRTLRWLIRLRLPKLWSTLRVLRGQRAARWMIR